MTIRVMKIAIVLALVLTLSALTVVTGCKKSGEDEQSSGAGEVQAKDIEQKVCPVMGNPIDPQYYTEYQGKKVYFCCPACMGKFEKNPEQYLDKLPQFKEQAEAMQKEAEAMKEKAEQAGEKASEEMKDAMEGMAQ